MISELFYIHIKTYQVFNSQIFYHLNYTGVHLGLITKLIESDMFLSGFWDPPSCQSAPILFAFPTHFAPPLRWARSAADIKDLSETLPGLRNQSKSCVSRLHSQRADMVKPRWQTVSDRNWTWQSQCEFESVQNLQSFLSQKIERERSRYCIQTRRLAVWQGSVHTRRQGLMYCENRLQGTGFTKTCYMFNDV